MVKKEKNKFGKKTLAKAVRNYYLIFNTLLLLVFGICMLGISIKLYIENVENSNQVITEQAGYSVNKTLTDIVNQMVTFSSYHDIISQLGKKELTVQEELNLERELTTLLKKTDVFNSVVQDIFLIADNGFVFSTLTKSSLAANYDFENQSWFQKAKDISDHTFVHILGLHQQDYYGVSIRPEAAGKETFSMSFAVENAKGKVIGALIYNFDLERMGKILGDINYETNGKVYLLDENGIIVSESENENIGQNGPVSPEDFQRMKEEGKGSFRTTYENEGYYISFQKTSMGMWLVASTPLREIWKHAFPMLVLLLLMLFVCLFINLLISSGVSKSIRKPVKRLTENIENMDSEHLVLPTDEYRYEELNRIAEKFEKLLERVDALIEKDYKSQILLNKFRLYSLQSQINPHFLMNTLQQLQTEIVYGNVENSNNIVVSLSRMLRYSLYNYDEIVPISMELEYIQSYLNLFAQKYDGELQIEYEITPCIMNCLMPKMILQPIAENCICHAFDENPCGAVMKIKVKEMEKGFLFSVEDNGQGMSEEQLEEIKKDLDNSEIDNSRIGVRNIHRRIRLLYGTEYGINIVSRKGYGTCFTILIPKIQKEEKQQ